MDNPRIFERPKSNGFFFGGPRCKNGNCRSTFQLADMFGVKEEESPGARKKTSRMMTKTPRGDQKASDYQERKRNLVVTVICPKTMRQEGRLCAKRLQSSEACKSGIRLRRCGDRRRDTTLCSRASYPSIFVS